MKENLWLLEKKELTDKVKELEGKLAAAEAVSADLRHKNNMLENCLRQNRAKAGQEGREEDEKEPEVPIPQRRPKSNRSHINRILSSLGVGNVLENITQDIKSKGANSTLKIE